MHTSAPKYLTSKSFELGQLRIASDFVTFEIERQFDDLYENALGALTNLCAGSMEMAAEFSQYLPQVLKASEEREYKTVVFRKTPDQILVADILANTGGTLPPEHVAWIINALLNIACYLQWLELVHPAINADTLFISPLRHSVMLLGGWWYAQREGYTFAALPDATVPLVSVDVAPQADCGLHVELIKALGRKLLGYEDKTLLLSDRTIPLDMSWWLTESTTGDALSAYRSWKNEVLPVCFGQPRFIEWRLNAADVYKEK
jgi:hypothetical protein